MQAWKNWREGTPLNIIDPTLVDGSRDEMMRCIHIGLLCAQESVAERPTMASIVLMLNSYTQTLQVPSQPAFVGYSGMEPSYSLQETSSGVRKSVERKSRSADLSKHEVSITELEPR